MEQPDPVHGKHRVRDLQTQTTGLEQCPAAARRRPVSPAKADRCPRCGYSYRGLPDGTACPECGLLVHEGAFVFYGSRARVQKSDLVYLGLLLWNGCGTLNMAFRGNLGGLAVNALAELLIAALWWWTRSRKQHYVVVDRTDAYLRQAG